MRVWVRSSSAIIFDALARLLGGLGCSVDPEPQAGTDVALWDLRAALTYPSAHATLPTLALVAERRESAALLLQQRYRGYLTPGDGLLELKAALQAVRRGEIWAPRQVITRAITRSLAVGLTGRESEIRDLVTSGLSNRAIAERLAIAEPTVKKHVSSILSKYNVRRRGELIAVHLRGVPPGPVRSEDTD